MATTGKALGASGVLFTDRRDFYLSPQITKELWPDVAPFTTIVANRNSITGLADPIFKMFEHRSPWIKQQFQVNSTVATVNSNGTESGDIDIDGITNLASSADASYLGLVVEVWNEALTTKKGVMIVTTVTDSNTLKFKHLHPAGTSITTADNDYLIVVGNAQGEGGTSPQAWADELKVVYGSTQIMRTPIEVTGTLYQAALRGYSNELARLRMEKAKEHKMQKERTFLFGGSPMLMNLASNGNDSFADTSRTVGGLTTRTTLGIIPAIEKYGSSTTTDDDQGIFTITEASYTYADFVDDMEKVFRYLPTDGTKYALCGPGALSFWSKLSANDGFVSASGWQVQISGSQRDSLGFNIRTLETPHGVLKLIHTPALRGPYSKYMVVLSDENLSHVQYRPMSFKTNIKTDDGYDGVKDEYFSDEGLGMTLIESHKLFKIQ